MGAGEPGVTPERIVDTLQAFQRTEALRAAIELDVFTALSEGVDRLPELARRLHASERGLRALLNFLATLGFVEKDGARYRPAPDAARYLDRRSPAFLGDSASFYTSPTFREGFLAAAEAVRRGGSDPQRVDSMRADHPVWVEYARTMAPLFRGAAESLAELVLARTPSPVKVLDVAAGHGLFGIAIARRAPSAVVTAVDWPAVLGLATAHANAAGVGDRYRVLAGSAFDAPLGGPYDLIVVANFLHHFEPARVDLLLHRLARALTPAGWLAIVEFVPNEDRVTPPSVARFGLSMVATTPAGDVFTFPELSERLTAAGLSSPSLHPLARSPERAVLAQKPRA